MSAEHYFSKEPTSNYQAKKIELEIAGSVFQLATASGTFSPLKLDTGTEILLQHLDLAPLDGNILDLGCGWGPIALNLAKHSPKATIWAVDVNTRSLELTTRNASDLDLINMKIATPDQVPTEIQFSGIWSNPPIRIGKRALHELLLQWLPRLEVAGCAYLVVQKNLGSDSLQRWLEATLESNYQVSRLTSIKTYRILKVKKIN